MPTPKKLNPMPANAPRNTPTVLIAMLKTFSKVGDMTISQLAAEMQIDASLAYERIKHCKTRQVIERRNTVAPAIFGLTLAGAELALDTDALIIEQNNKAIRKVKEHLLKPVTYRSQVSSIFAFGDVCGGIGAVLNVQVTHC